jgi:TolB-like protein/class 3 adenylate cyclase
MAETRKLAAILAADVVGYSRLAGSDEDRTLARLRALRSDLIDPTIAVHHGRVVKRTGDGSLIEFRSVVDAVRCAIEVQNGMVERNAGLPPERRIEFRVGIHLGDVVEESDGDLMGDGVNIAARLEGIAKPGSIFLSEDAYRQVRARLDLAVNDLGDTQLKNIVHPVRVYSLEVGLPAQAKAATVAKASEEAQLPQPKKHSTLAALAAAAVLIALIGAGAWYLVGANRSATVASNASGARPEAAHLSIVVLPFTNLSNDPSQDYLADALTEELTTSLSRLPGSFVIARSTAFTYKGKAADVKQVGQELGVRYALEGSVQNSGERFRVNAQLLETSTGAHLWVDQFDEQRADLLQMQDEIVIRLARTLSIQITAIEAARIARARIANTDAETLALRCQAIVFNYGANRNEVAAAYPLCEQALQLDPNIARALAIIARRYALQALQGQSVDRKADTTKADELIARALTIDANDYYVYYVKALVLAAQGRQEEAIVQAEHSLALNPSHINDYAALWVANFYLGRGKQAAEYADKAIRLSPRDPILYEFYFEKGAAYFLLEDYLTAIEWLQRATAANPNYSSPQQDLAAALALVGREAEARETLATYLALSQTKTKTIAQVTPAIAHTPGAYAQHVIEGLRKAGMPEE